MKQVQRLLILLITLVSTYSCEKEVMIDLQTIEPRLVIDASIGHMEPCVVRLTLTQDYWDQNPPKGVRGAIVTLKDKTGNVEVLMNSGEEGVYISTIKGKIGETYTLTVEVEDEVYEATDQIPTMVPIDSAKLYKLDIAGDSYFYPIIWVTDPAEEENYYLYSFSINGNQTLQNKQVMSDKYYDGLVIDFLIMFDKENNDDKELAVGDELEISLQSIGKGAYTYYNTLNPPGGVATSNPESNFTGDVLGVFRTYSLDVVIKVLDEDDFKL